MNYRCDNLTISPALIEQLYSTPGEMELKLDPYKAKEMYFKKINVDEKTFRWALNEDPMATEKLAEGIRNFSPKDLIKLEKSIIKSLKDK